ncbi:MAG TPA: histidine kinase [Bryobacteraceae bacterium]|nr:histidine kinase [Bryobacteraceae bacterium]
MLRLARVALALAGACSAEWLAGAGYVAFALAMLSDFRHKSGWRFWVECAADAGYFALWTRLAPGTWLAAASLCYALASSVLQRGVAETAAVAAGATAIFPRAAPAGALALAAAFYQRHLHRRISALLGQNLAHRSQAQRAREAERERIAANFHDGPLQSFVGFQMRLEIVKKLLARGDAGAAAEEIRQLQESGRSQIADLRRFARSMRPAEEGLPLRESARRAVETFQRDTHIQASFSARGLAEEEPPAAAEVLQILGEALHNVWKHSGATRATVSMEQKDGALEVVIEDNGSGFAFCGDYNLEELDRLRIGPVSLKRRVRLLGGELFIESAPGRGAKLRIRVPV